jgi:SAM-dependent methyltransferase
VTNMGSRDRAPPPGEDDIWLHDNSVANRPRAMVADDGGRRAAGRPRTPMIDDLPSNLDDDWFDSQLPPWMRAKSALHFTPVKVARRAAQLLAPAPGMRVLDVGSGSGKFCVVAAREAPTCTFVGVEIRSHLVKRARKLAARALTANAVFIEGDAMELDWSAYDAFYFYNPFAEHLHAKDLVLDGTLAVDPSRFDTYVTAVHERLSSTRIGVRVVTYHSLGAAAPACYDLVESHAIGTDRLDLWIKQRAA